MSQQTSLARLCQEFEAQPERGTKAVSNFLETAASNLDAEERRELGRELIMMDLEIGLQHRASESPLLGPAYAKIVTNVDMNCIGEIAVFEFRCRLEMEMQPLVTEFVQAFPEIPNLFEELCSTCVEYDSYFMNVDPMGRNRRGNEGEECEPRILHMGYDPIEFGRRSSADEEPISQTFGRQRRRVVVTPATDLRISRQHFSITREHRDEIRIHNVSRKSQVVVEPTGRIPEKLNPTDQLKFNLKEGSRGPSCVVCSIYIGQQTVISIHANV